MRSSSHRALALILNSHTRTQMARLPHTLSLFLCVARADCCGLSRCGVVVCRLFQLRAKFYELLTNCIPAEVIVAARGCLRLSSLDSGPMSPPYPRPCPCVS